MPTTKLGLPCWDKTNVPKAISSTAKMDAGHIDYFLASHVPVQNISHDETQELFTEETFFKELMKPNHGELLALVHGDPGTGKSHLIHWLKLRCEDALKRQELKNLVPILIQRRTGSLKDALEQMIDQLPPGFERYLTPVKEALSRISDATAREKLSGDLYLELGSRRTDRNREPITGDLRNLREVCASAGFRQWICREGGVIDQNVKRLTQGSDVAEREALPQFTEREFNITDARYKRENTPEVRNLIDDFTDEYSLRERAAQYLNEVLPDAIKEMTGLSGTRLRDIFDQIRADLQKQGKELALFIEDVSVMSALDEEVFVAVEPQSRDDLCRMVAVLGATNQGWNRLPDNQKQRITHPVSVGGTVAGEWRSSPLTVAEFAARYLNTTRLTTDEVSAVAQQRRGGNDVNISACDRCPVRENCHAIFDKVTIGDIDIGMFPFTPIAPQRLLMHLQEHVAVHKNPRGLLTRVLQPVLDFGYESLESKDFPPGRKIAVSMPELPYWAGFEPRYCGGWPSDDKARLKFLAQAWVLANNADEAAAQLKPFLAPLGFREFSRAPVILPPQPPPGDEQRKVSQPEPQPGNPKLDGILSNLGDWIAGEALVGDKEIRELLANFLRKSIPWDDERVPPLEVWKTLIGGASNYKFVRIEGMRSSPVGTLFFIDFERSEETRSLIESLAQYEYAGKRSWNFPHGEVHKRTVVRWSRRNTDRIVHQLQPRSDLPTELPVTSAVQILALNATVRRRSKLPTEPQDAPELLKILLTDNDGSLPEALSAEWKLLLDDARLKQPAVKKFLVTELDVPQGRGSLGINFIDPLTIIQAASNFVGDPKVVVPGEEFSKDFWRGRYSIFEGSSHYSGLHDALEQERTAIREHVDNIDYLLRASGYDTEDMPNALLNYCADLLEIINAQKIANLYQPDAAFDDLKTRKVFSERKDVWATSIRQAQGVASGTDLLEVILFDPKTLKEARNSVAVAVNYFSDVEKLANEMLRHIEQEGDPDVLSDSILQTLGEIANQAGESSEEVGEV